MWSRTSSIYRQLDITNVVEYIKNKLYFATLAPGRREIRITRDIVPFSIDSELVYNNFYNDFGPLNLACLYKYCCQVNEKLRSSANKHKQVLHYTSLDQKKRTNAAYLIASYAILYLKKTPKEAIRPLIVGNTQPFLPFQDASIGISGYTIRLLDCLNAIHKAAAFGFFNFEDFDLAEYEKYEQMKNGDLNWMVPQKFLAFVGPSTEVGSAYHPPERYIDYFVRNGAIAVVRLNKKSYEASRFTRAGIMHYDMFMPDGSVPPRRILNQFLQLAETTNGPIAVHCKAGLGRTGSLIAAYLIKHYRMTAREAIAWMRICRPGSVIGHQQAWLEDIESFLWRAGHQYRLKYHRDGDMILHHKRGIYSIAYKLEQKINFALGTERFTCNGAENNLDVSDVPRKRKVRTSVPEAQKCNLTSFSKINKPGLSCILGKLCNIGGNALISSELNTSGLRQKIDADMVKYNSILPMNKSEITQGDRLNEIKIKRNKLSVNSLLFPKNNSLSVPTEPITRSQKKQ
ncbi:dual specificity protein phosphatase CDC14A [Orussus abietinus]|uniref:dual specificity protein phosphatase CDC14A n=1 Tax=Orussus abietinus TaxID=222816 RepID=UPI000626967D|nr:dual specificity protein phosphatase CDC14A [Orussus abietinus]